MQTTLLHSGQNVKKNKTEWRYRRASKSRQKFIWALKEGNHAGWYAHFYSFLLWVIPQSLKCRVARMQAESCSLISLRSQSRSLRLPEKTDLRGEAPKKGLIEEIASKFACKINSSNWLNFDCTCIGNIPIIAWRLEQLNKRF